MSHNFTKKIRSNYAYRQAISRKNGASWDQLHLAAISSKYWVLCAREAIKEWQNQCAKCKKTRALPGVQLMAPLSDSRVQIPLRAFAQIAVDFTGPFITIKGREKKRRKRYLCLFTCLACRAVHLEMAYGLDTDSFLKTLFRKINRRGYLIEVVSDNAGNFSEAEKELNKLWSKINHKKFIVALLIIELLGLSFPH